MATVADFLKSIGMAEYAAGLTEGGIDVSALQVSTIRDLERLGIAPDDRDKFLRAIAGFQPDPELAPAGGRSVPSTVSSAGSTTILFGDLVGSTAISTRLDPEALHEIMGPYRKRCAETIERAGGFVARYLGDGVLAYFGYPHASEDAAERAINAGSRWSKRSVNFAMTWARRCRLGSASRAALSSSVIWPARARRTTTTWSAKHPTLPRGCRPTLSRIRSSSAPRRVGWLAAFSSVRPG